MKWLAIVFHYRTVGIPNLLRIAVRAGASPLRPLLPPCPCRMGLDDLDPIGGVMGEKKKHQKRAKPIICNYYYSNSHTGMEYVQRFDSRIMRMY